MSGFHVAGELSDLYGREIGGDVLQKASKTGLQDSSAPELSFSHSHSSLNEASGSAQLVMPPFCVSFF